MPSILRSDFENPPRRRPPPPAKMIAPKRGPSEESWLDASERSWLDAAEPSRFAILRANSRAAFRMFSRAVASDSSSDCPSGFIATRTGLGASFSDSNWNDSSIAPPKIASWTRVFGVPDAGGGFSGEGLRINFALAGYDQVGFGN